MFQNRKFLLSLCVTSMLATCVPAAISISQLINVRKGIEDVERDSSISAHSRNILDIVAQSLPSFTAITLELSDEELRDVLAETDQHFAKLEQAVSALRSTGSSFISKERDAALTEAINSVTHSWEEIREQTGVTMVPAEQTYHFLRIFDDIRKARKVLNLIDQDAAISAAATTKSSFERVARANVMIVSSVLGAALIGLIAIASNFQFARTMRRSNEQLIEKNQEIEELNATLEERIDQRTSELKATYRELEGNLKKLSETQNELVRKSKLAQMGQLTATVAHEIRNPLAAVRTSTFLIKRKLESTEIDLSKPIERIDHGIERCNKIISELLDFTRVDQLRKEAVHFDDWVLATVKDQSEQLPELVSIECALSADSLKVEFDADRMLRVLNNMLSNASEAMVGRDGRLEDIVVQDPQIKISSHKTQRGIELKVADNGPGLNPEQLIKIFEPLYSTKGFGIGLGVPAMQQVLQQHGGGLEYQSEVGKGTTATAWFPLEFSESAPVSHQSVPEKFQAA